MVRTYFVNSLNEAVLTTCHVNPFHIDTHRFKYLYLFPHLAFLSLKVYPPLIKT